MNRENYVLAGTVLALMVGIWISFLSSGSPDGLEQREANTIGSATERYSASLMSLPGYIATPLGNAKTSEALAVALSAFIVIAASSTMPKHHRREKR